MTSAEGIGFAVPINIIKPILEKLEKEGSFTAATLGIFAFDKKVLPYLEEDIEFESGIYVESVLPESAAAKGGILKKDIITQIDNRHISKMSDLREYIYQKNPNDFVKIKLKRRNVEREIIVQLAEKK